MQSLCNSKWAWQSLVLAESAFISFSSTFQAPFNNNNIRHNNICLKYGATGVFAESKISFFCFCKLPVKLRSTFAFSILCLKMLILHLIKIAFKKEMSFTKKKLIRDALKVMRFSGSDFIHRKVENSEIKNKYE